MQNRIIGTGAALVILHSGAAMAQSADEGTQSVIVTGTRTQGLKAVDSAAPVQVIDSSTLRQTGQTDVMQALAAVLPSYTAEAAGFDTAALSLSARLRGLSPNDALVLVNGKRRHTTANLHVDGGSPSSGAAAADLSFIPMSAVDHVEVLLDGAAAQYGTDAIAGVVNIILKRNASGGQADASVGQYIDGGGNTTSGSINMGFAPADNAFVNASIETKFHGFSNRGAIDARLLNPDVLNDPVNGNVVNFPGYPYSNKISGDAQYRTSILSLNSGLDVSPDFHLYSFGTYGVRRAQGYENYRLPSRIPEIYPLGFNPKEAMNESDAALTVGAKGTVAAWDWDLSATTGVDFEKIYTLNSGNASLNGQYVVPPAVNGYTPTDFHDGNFKTGQDTLNFDLTHEYDVGLSAPLTLAMGLEARKDRYEIDPGDPDSYYLSGAQSFVGYSPANSGKYSRSNESAYLDVAFSPIKNMQVDAAARFEHYSDFGDAKVGKLTSRYDFTPDFGMRGTISNGFRAPTLAEQFYSGNNVGPDSIYLQLPPNSAAAKTLGIENLKPEKSTNLSLGFVAHPSKASLITVDLYQIILKDRIVASGSFTGYRGANDPPVINQTILDALTAAGIPPSTYEAPTGTAGVQFFNNGADTKTTGIDLVGTYAANYGQYGAVDWSLGGNYSKTTVTKIAPTPALLNSPGPILDLVAQSALTSASPKFKVNAGGIWRLGSWSVMFRESFYGPSSFYQQDENGNYVNSKLTSKFLTDLELSDKVTKSWTFAVGAKNLFNVYPDKINPVILDSYKAAYDNSNVTQYPISSPFGINGGFYYARASYKF